LFAKKPLRERLILDEKKKAGWKDSNKQIHKDIFQQQEFYNNTIKSEDKFDF
jgi:hypothetical protein